MSLATPSIVNGSSLAHAPPPPHPDRSSGDFCNAPMDRQPQAPRRSISPVHRTKKERNETKKVDNHGGKHSIDNDLEYISHLYGDDGNPDTIGEAESSEYGVAGQGRDVFFDMPPTPPLRHIHEHVEDGSPYRLFGKKKHEYDRTRRPARSSMKKPNSKNRNINSIDNSLHNKKDVSRGIIRNHSADGTEDTRRGSGTLHSVRMRGSITPVNVDSPSNLKKLSPLRRSSQRSN